MRLNTHFALTVLLLLFSSYGYNQVVSGVITDENGESMPSVNISVPGTSFGASSDAMPPALARLCDRLGELLGFVPDTC